MMADYSSYIYVISQNQVKCIEGDCDGLHTTRKKLVLPYTDSNIIPNSMRKNKTRDIQCGVQVCGEIKVGFRNPAQILNS